MTESEIGRARISLVEVAEELAAGRLRVVPGSSGRSGPGMTVERTLRALASDEMEEALLWQHQPPALPDATYWLVNDPAGIEAAARALTHEEPGPLRYAVDMRTGEVDWNLPGEPGSRFPVRYLAVPEVVAEWCRQFGVDADGRALLDRWSEVVRLPRVPFVAAHTRRPGDLVDLLPRDSRDLSVRDPARLLARLAWVGAAPAAAPWPPEPEQRPRARSLEEADRRVMEIFAAMPDVSRSLPADVYAASARPGYSAVDDVELYRFALAYQGRPDDPDALGSELDDLIGFYRRVSAAVGELFDFLRDDCGIPHRRLSLYGNPATDREQVLLRFIARHGRPTGTAAVLLRRWYWRAGATTAHLYAHLWHGLVGPDPERSAEALLRRVPPEEYHNATMDPDAPVNRLALNLGTSSATLALLRAGPRDLATGRPVDPRTLLEDDPREVGVRILEPAPDHPLADTMAGRLLAPAPDGRSPVDALVAADPEVASSHLVDPVAVRLLRDGDHAGFLERRARAIAAADRDLVRGQAEWPSPPQRRPGLATPVAGGPEPAPEDLAWSLPELLDRLRDGRVRGVPGLTDQLSAVRDVRAWDALTGDGDLDLVLWQDPLDTTPEPVRWVLTDPAFVLQAARVLDRPARRIARCSGWLDLSTGQLYDGGRGEHDLMPPALLLDDGARAAWFVRHHGRVPDGAVALADGLAARLAGRRISVRVHRTGRLAEVARLAGARDEQVAYCRVAPEETEWPAPPEPVAAGAVELWDGEMTAQ